MSTVRSWHSGFRFLRMHCVAAVTTALLSATCLAEPLSVTTPKDDAFYHQLLKLPENNGYHPTRTFTIVTDAEHGDQLVAEDDPNLRFNLLWMQQYRPGYKTRNGGAALGDIFRSYVKSAYKSYRSRNAQGSSMLPDENGSVRSKSDYSGEMDYNVKVTGDEVRFKVEYSY